jgi:hypothetical protein
MVLSPDILSPGCKKQDHYVKPQVIMDGVSFALEKEKTAIPVLYRDGRSVTVAPCEESALELESGSERLATANTNRWWKSLGR